MRIPTEPTWDQGIKRPRFSKLTSNREADVGIIGGGMAGIVCAYLLARAGKSVILLEKDKVGFGATGMTTAFLTQIIDTDIVKLIKMYGKQKAKRILDSHQEAIDLVEKIVEEEAIECEFIRCNNYCYVNREDERKELQEEAKAAHTIGISLLLHEDDRLGFKQAGYVQRNNQAKFHPLKYLYGVAEVAIDLSAEIYEDAEVISVQKKRKGFKLKTRLHAADVQYVVVATHAPFDKKLPFKKAFYDSYVYELEIPHGVIAEGIYEDNLDPYHYFRLDSGKKKDRLIIGGEDHRSDIPVPSTKNFQALLEYTKSILGTTSYRLVRKWKGPILETIDGLAYIGPLKDPHVYYATGFSGNGMTYSHVAGRIICNRILKKKDVYAVLYDAKRQPTLPRLAYKGVDYTRELMHGAVRNAFRRTKK